MNRGPTNVSHGSFVFPHVTGVVTAELPQATTGAEPAVRLGAMFDTHHQRLYRLARRLSANADDAQDLVQETFLRAARSLGSVPAGKEEAWLVRVLVNIQRDGWRRTAALRRIDPEREAYDARPAPADHEAALIARATVQRALERLAPRRRAVVVLHDLEDASVGEIARLLGVTAVTVRWHLSRGRRELASVIGEQGRTS